MTGQILTTEREQIIEECKAVMREQMRLYRAETLSSSAARVAIEHCIDAVDELKQREIAMHIDSQT